MTINGSTVPITQSRIRSHNGNCSVLRSSLAAIEKKIAVYVAFSSITVVRRLMRRFAGGNCRINSMLSL